MNMRAKFLITKVTQHRKDGLPEGEVVGEALEMIAVCSKPFDKDGYSEDNTFAKYTPTAYCSLTILNPALLNQYKVGDKYYSDFSKAED
jgi:hypothetical protein